MKGSCKSSAFARHRRQTLKPGKTQPLAPGNVVIKKCEGRSITSRDTSHCTSRKTFKREKRTSYERENRSEVAWDIGVTRESTTHAQGKARASSRAQREAARTKLREQWRACYRSGNSSDESESAAISFRNFRPLCVDACHTDQSRRSNTTGKPGNRAAYDPYAEGREIEITHRDLRMYQASKAQLRLTGGCNRGPHANSSSPCGSALNADWRNRS